MVFVTGDLHGNFERFKPKYFPEQARMTKQDITCKRPIPQPTASLPAMCAGCGTSTGCTAIRRSCWQRQCV